MTNRRTDRIARELARQRREPLRRDLRPAALDYARLSAGVSAAQAVSPTARAQARRRSDPVVPAAPLEALTLVLDAARGWSAAAGALGGSFHPSVAARARETGP